MYKYVSTYLEKGGPDKQYMWASELLLVFYFL